MRRFFATLLLGLSLPGQVLAADGVLPSWLTLGGEIRGRMEGASNIRFNPDNDDYYYLHRIRLNIGVRVTPWLRVFVQGQDAHAPGYDKPVPSSVANTGDLRQGYFELGHLDKPGWGLRAGRQEFIFGDERLVGAANWGNVGRTFDAVRLTWQRPGTRLDWFTSSVVAPVQNRFDRPHFNNKLHGFYSSFDRLVPRAVWQGYLFVKTVSHAASEAGAWGNSRLYTMGVRGKGALPHRMDYMLEVAGQTGQVSGDTARAWAGHAQLGCTVSKAKSAPRLIAEYDHATGDRNPRDGHRGTFDQLYPTNHFRYGIADQIGWRNMHDATGGVEWKFHPKWRLNVDVHSFWLASRADSLYAAGGAAVVRNPKATSSHVGNELDANLVYRHSEKLSFVGGIGHLFAGGFLRQSTPGSGLTAPYVMWTWTL